MFLYMRLDRQFQHGDRVEKRRPPFIQPTCAINIAARFPGGDDHLGLKTNPNEGMGMPKPDPKHGAWVMQLQHSRMRQGWLMEQ